MKQITLHFLLLGMLSTAMPAAADQDAFDRANRLYGGGKYADALQLYRELEGNCKNWKIYYNAGNACFKMGNFLEAKIYFLKAKKLKPLSPLIETNVRIVNRRFRDKIPAAKSDFFSDLALKLEAWLPDNSLFALLLIFSLAANLLLFLFVKGKHSHAILYFMIFFFISFFLLFGYQRQRSIRRQSVSVAVVMHENTELRSGPGPENTVLFKINSGLELRILERNQEWYQVSASEQIAGWIEAGAVELI